MFWSDDTKLSPPDLRTELLGKLWVAFDFATLGAYDEFDKPVAAPRRAEQALAAPVKREAPPKRVFLFSRVSPPCSHSPEPKTHACVDPSNERRRPSSEVPEQPCMWAGARVTL